MLWLNIVGKHWVTCIKRDVDHYGRVVAICRAGPINLNAWMVGNGWAVAYRRYSMDYIRDENEAKAAGKGLWRVEFFLLAGIKKGKLHHYRRPGY